MTTYIVTFSTTTEAGENASYLQDTIEIMIGAGHKNIRHEANSNIIELNDEAYQVLCGMQEHNDGFIDDNKIMWICGLDYPVVQL